MDSKGVIYILGPMRGYPDLNFSEFDEAAYVLELLGWTVINPATNPEGLKGSREYIMVDLAFIFGCDAVCRLKGWKDSKGARLESALAEYLDLAIIEEKDLWDEI